MFFEKKNVRYSFDIFLQTLILNYSNCGVLIKNYLEGKKHVARI